MHGVSAAPAGGVDQAFDRQVTLQRRRRSDMHGAIGRGDVRRTDIRVRVHRDRFNAQLAACVDDTQGNLAAVGDEDALDHRDQRGGRLPRNARNPSWPSADLRRAAMASAVNVAASSGSMSDTVRIKLLAAAMASGPPVASSARYPSTVASRSAAGTTA